MLKSAPLLIRATSVENVDPAGIKIFLELRTDTIDSKPLLEYNTRMNEETTTNLSDVYEDCYAGTLVLQTKMTMGITHDIVTSYLTLCSKTTWLLDNSEPDWWTDEELEGLTAIIGDCHNLGLEIREWVQERVDEQEEMDGI